MSLPINYSFGSAPFCNVCNRVVDRWQVDYKYGMIRGYDRWYPTDHDMIKLTVECHGEVFEQEYYK